MGVRNYLIEGVSGAGKTTVATELGRRGYQAIHGDRELVYRGDPETGCPVATPANASALWMSRHQIWDLDKVKGYVAGRHEPATFFCGGSRNFAKFIHLLDDVFVLDVDEATMNRRIEQRVAADPTDFGTKPEDRELITRLFKTKENTPRDAKVIDATRPLSEVVDDLLRRCGLPAALSTHR